MKEDRYRKGIIKYKGEKAGIIEETENGYRFTYDDVFLKQGISISVSLPAKQKTHESEDLFPFFEGLLPEGWYLDIVRKTMKIDKNNKFDLLLSTCGDTIGAVSVEEIQ